MLYYVAYIIPFGKNFMADSLKIMFWFDHKQIDCIILN